MKQKSILIFSGGSGSEQLVKGLYKYNSNNIFHITHILNAYDDGKSTGIVRKICNTLGPSDIRKVQYIHHKLTHNFGNGLLYINNLYTSRLNLSWNISESQKIIFKVLEDNVINKSILDFFKYLVYEFYRLVENSSFTQSSNIFNDFNIMNILYSVMFKYYGYEHTIKYFKEFLQINADVILDTHDNIFLSCIDENNKIHNTEKSIVTFSNDFPDSSIRLIEFNKQYTVNIKAQEELNNADLILFSPGTQWSSLIPTYKTLNNDILKSNAKKILILNNEPDYDDLDSSSEKMLRNIKKYLSGDNIDVFINLDSSNKKMKKDIGVIYYKFKLYYKKLGVSNNNNKLHNSELLAREIFKHYYNIAESNIYLFDFDDTIYSRNKNEKYISNLNLKLLNNIKQTRRYILSGNSGASLYSKIKNNYHGYIWSDKGDTFTYYTDADKILNITHTAQSNIKTDLNKVINIFEGLTHLIIWYDTYIKIKPLNYHERNVLSIIIQKRLDDFYGKDKYKVLKTGNTTIDIFNGFSDKSNVLRSSILKNKVYSCVYISDTHDIKFDEAILESGVKTILVNSVFETNLILTLIGI